MTEKDPKFVSTKVGEKSEREHRESLLAALDIENVRTDQNTRSFAPMHEFEAVSFESVSGGVWYIKAVPHPWHSWNDSTPIDTQ